MNRDADTAKPSRPAKVMRVLEEMKSVAPICAFNNVRVFSRSVERLYDDAFRPAGLSASQVALLWTVLATEPVLLKDLAKFSSSDQTTLSRTVARAEDLGLLTIDKANADQRQKVVRLSAQGRTRLAEILPVWKRVQASVESWMDLDALRRLASKARRGFNT